MLQFTISGIFEIPGTFLHEHRKHSIRNLRIVNRKSAQRWLGSKSRNIPATQRCDWQGWSMFPGQSSSLVQQQGLPAFLFTRLRQMRILYTKRWIFRNFRAKLKYIHLELFVATHQKQLPHQEVCPMSLDSTKIADEPKRCVQKGTSLG